MALDDTDQQQRIQLATTQHSSQLNLGHLIHQADNYRGSFRGTGIELRTDAWGALRAGQGMVITTWAGTPEQPAGDMAPAIALLKQADTLAQTLNQAAATHQTVQLASSLGTQGKNQSKIDEQAAPLKALHTLSRGMVDPKDQGTAQSDAQQKNTGTTDKLPHLTDPAILQSGKAGIGSIAGQSLQFANGEALTLASGEDTNLAVAGKARIHTGQAIGLLPDQVPPLGQGIWSPFFGREAYTMTLAARLALQTGATVLLVRCEREPMGRGFVMYAEPLPQPLDADLETAVRQVNEAMEHVIRQCPGQYLWGYGRYKQPRAEAPAVEASS